MTTLLHRVRRRAARQLGMELPRDEAAGAGALNRLAEARDRLAGLDDESRRFLSFAAARLAQSRAQLLQDLFVLWVLGEQRDGFFVEFGATDGVGISNTVLLERDYGWRGILAEPARVWHQRLDAARGCAIDHRCVTDRTGDTVTFNEAPNAELSTIAALTKGDHHARARRGGIRYHVPTVSLNDLLRDHDAPARFDYLSVDTEGSELTILSALDFDAHRPRVVTVEHNFGAQRGGLHALLTGRGYARRLEALSQFDDWYVAP